MDNALVVLNNQPKELTFLGETGLCKYTEKGILKGMEISVKLYLSKNHIYAQKNGTGENSPVSYKITSEGYEYLNKFACLQEIHEPSIEIDGKQFPNPYINLDEFGKKNKVYQKVTLAGRDTNGDIKFSTSIILADASDMVISEISNKLKYDKQENLGYYSTHEEYLEDKEKERGLKYIPLDYDSGIVIKLRSEEYRKLKANVDDKRATIERKTHTVAKRNAFRKHPATSYYTVTPTQIKGANSGTVDLVATVKVIKWVNQRDEELEKAIRDYLDNKKDDDYAEKITETDDEYTDLEDGQDLPDEYITMDEAIEMTEETLEAAACAEDDVERKKVINYVQEAIKILSPEELVIIMQRRPAIEEMSITELNALKHEIDKIADGGIDE